MEKQNYKYKGAIHIHTIFSDGTGNINEISKSAKKAGLDWIIISDHNSMEAKEGIYNGVYIFKANEVSADCSNHYLTFGLDSCIEPNQNLQDLINEVRNNGGFGFAAHPDESDKRKNNHRPIKWLDKNIIPDGVEIWNWFSEWANNLNDRNIFSLAYAYLFKHNLIHKPCEETLSWWDKLNNNDNNIVPAIGGVDAHALKFKGYIIPVTVFPYGTMFKTIMNVITLNRVLSSDFEEAKKQVFKAIRSGNNLVINSHINKNIPEVFVQNNAEKAYSGEIIKLTDNTYLNIECKNKYLIKVLRNGVEIFRDLARELKLLIRETGKYRVEILKKNGRGFAYSNPILVV